jgi:hypothetical protein
VRFLRGHRRRSELKEHDATVLSIAEVMLTLRIREKVRTRTIRLSLQDGSVAECRVQKSSRGSVSAVRLVTRTGLMLRVSKYQESNLRRIRSIICACGRTGIPILEELEEVEDSDAGPLIVP